MSRRNRIFRALLLCGAFVLFAVTSAEAGIYKCVGADGRTTFTSDPASCASAEPYELKARIQKSIDSSKSRALARRLSTGRAASPSGVAPEDGHEEMWRRKRGAARQELQNAERQVERAMSMAKGCNRGGEWFRKDASGIRKHVPCEEIKSRVGEAEKMRDDLKRYLASGLEDECRRAGCLPGWVR
jgi:hypothetical protein